MSLLGVLANVLFGSGISFLSFGYLIFLSAAALVRYLVPGKERCGALLAVSWIFYCTWNPACLIFVVLSTVSTYLAGLYVGRRENTYGSFGRQRREAGKAAGCEKSVRPAAGDGAGAGKEGTGSGRPGLPHRRAVLAGCLLLNLGLLFFCKYWGMFFPGMFTDRLLPIGISFYTLQALGYLIDCWRYGSRTEDEQEEGNTGHAAGRAPEIHFVRYALFVSFFPGILSGPVERGRNMLPQFEEPCDFRYDNLRNGLTIMLWGYFLKMVIADRIAIVVDRVYGDPGGWPGVMVILAVFLYSLQIYCDFAGYSAIAVGSARVLGFRVMQNFSAPYLSASIAEFWRRWHISLSSWFRDYLYIPLGGSRKGQLRRYLNLLIVFAVSGLWHGADLTFVVWGLIHGLYQVAGYLLGPLRDGAVRLLHIDRSSASHRLLQTVWTFLLVSFAWIFFRADSLQDAWTVLRSMGGVEIWHLFDGSLLGLGLDIMNWILLVLSLALLFIRDLCVYRGISLRVRLQGQGRWLRWMLYIAAVLLILVCGIWGPDYDASTFIYSQF